MRHKKSGRKLGRNPSHRKALLRNMAKALLIHGRITTTEAKAKTLRGVVEPLVTLALKNDLHARRQAYRVLGEHKLVSRLFDEIGPTFADGGGGYTRVVKLAIPRKGDSAPMAVIEFVRNPGDPVPAATEKKAKLKAKAKTVKPEVSVVSVSTAPADAQPVEAETPNLPAVEEGEQLPAVKEENLPAVEEPQQAAPEEASSEAPAQGQEEQKAE